MAQDTIRECILKKLVEIFERSPLEPWDLEFGAVGRDPLTDDMVKTHDYTISITDPSERVREAVAVEYRDINLVIEFTGKVYEGDTASVIGNRALGAIQKRIGCDITLEDLALNSVLRGSEIDIEGPFDKVVSGVIVYDVTYRCRANDPFTAV